MKKQNGITLIALVISIIVMLILAGVSINAIVGENGVLSRAQYSSFMNEMAAVEEAVQLWKAGELIGSKGQVSTAIPATGLWERENIDPNSITEASKRLVGEMGYYRLWSKNGMPSNNILSLDDSLYNAFNGDFITYPAGVQDVYYLDNEALNLDKDKVYLIDATTSIIYSTTGINLNGVRCYSTYMAKAVMGNNVAPLFVEAEMSGGGDNIIYAGATYLKDKNGNYIDENGNIVSEDEKVLNPNGFQIIADATNDNIYKLYNTGDLYAKGVKGLLLNSDKKELEEIDNTIWKKIVIPENIPGASTNNIEIIPGAEDVFIIDSNKELWGIGSNNYNLLGLTDEQQVNYTGREVIKLNLFGNKVYKVFPTAYSTFVVTINTNGIYELYASGYNTYGELGIGNLNTTQTQFTKVEFENPEEIKIVGNKNREQHYMLILRENGQIYFSGRKSEFNFLFENSELGDNITTFTEILNGTYGEKLSSKIKDICWSSGNTNYSIETEDGKLYTISSVGIQEQAFKDETDIGYISDAWGGMGTSIVKRILENNEVEMWGKFDKYRLFLINCFDTEAVSNTWYNLADTIFQGINLNKIEDVLFNSSNIFVLLDDGTIYGYGPNVGLGLGTAVDENKQYRMINLNQKANLPKITKIVSDVEGDGFTIGIVILEDESGNYYLTRNQNIMYMDNILQQSWVKIATNVKKFHANCEDNKLAYLDRNNDLWVLGSDARNLGINISEAVEISNFVRMKDYLQGLEIYNSIDGKIEDYKVSTNAIYIYTNSEDNKSLYVCTQKDFLYSGVDVNSDMIENWNIPMKIMENVKYFDSNSHSRFLITDENELYCWGHNDGSCIGMDSSNVPKLYSGTTLNVPNIKLVYPSKYQSYVLEEDEIGEQKFYVTGTNHTTGATGINTSTTTWRLFDLNTYFKNEKIKGIVTSNQISNYIVLTNTNKLFAWGNANNIGIGRTDDTIIRTPIELSNMNDVVQIAAGKGFFIVVKNDGTVWGTGTNKYGVLGRWIGIDRNSPNSRYKTAFEWVECPELEI